MTNDSWLERWNYPDAQSYGYDFTQACRQGDTWIVEQFIRGGAPLNLLYDDVAPIHSAIHGGEVQIVDRLLDAGASLEFREKDGCTPLLTAIQNGHESIAAGLLNRGARVNVTNNADLSPLAYAMKRQLWTIADMLLDHPKLDVNFRTDPTMPAIFWAPVVAQECPKGINWLLDALLDRGSLTKGLSSSNGPVSLAHHIIARKLEIETKASLLASLVKRGISLDEPNQLGMTPFMYAKLCGWAPEVELLARLGANPDGLARIEILSKENLTNIDAVKKYLAASGDINTRDEAGRTLLARASAFSATDVIEHLITEGADPNQLDKDSWSPLAFAANTPAPEALEIVQRLVTSGVRVNETHMNSRALINAVNHQNLGVAEYLLDSGAAVDSRDSLEQTPLVIAVGKGNLDLVKKILSYDPSLEHLTDQRSSALHIAITRAVDKSDDPEGPRAEIVRLLVDKGADVNLPNVLGSPLIRAMAEGHNAMQRSLVSLLIEAGAAPDVGYSAIERHAGSEAGDFLVEQLTWKRWRAAFSQRTPQDVLTARDDATEERLQQMAKATTSTILGLWRKQEPRLANRLVELGAPLNAVTSSGLDPVFIDPDIQWLSLLLDHGLDTRLQYPSGAYRLHQAARKLPADCLDLFFRDRSLLNIPDSDGDYALVYAISKGRDHADFFLKNAPSHALAGLLSLLNASPTVDQVEHALSLGLPATEASRGRSALLVACERKLSPDMIRVLVEHGADPGYTSSKRETPLLLAINSGDEEVVKTLVELGAKANQPERQALSRRPELAKNLEPIIGPVPLPKVDRVLAEPLPLFRQIYTGDHGAVLSAIAQDSTVIETPNYLGDTPLMCAVRAGHASLACALMEAGADLTLENNRGETAKSLFQMSTRGYQHANLERLATRLKDAPMTAEQLVVSSDAREKFLKAIRRGNFDIIVDMISDGAIDPQAIDAQSTALTLAVAENDVELTRLLLTLGVQPLSDQPLISAATRTIELAEVLVAHGANTTPFALGEALTKTENPVAKWLWEKTDELPPPHDLWAALTEYGEQHCEWVLRVLPPKDVFSHCAALDASEVYASPQVRKIILGHADAAHLGTFRDGLLVEDKVYDAIAGLERYELLHATFDATLAPTDAATPNADDSVFGGPCLLPTGTAVPTDPKGKPLSFVGRIASSALQTLPGYDLPDTLMFFADTETEHCAVIAAASSSQWQVVDAPAMFTSQFILSTTVSSSGPGRNSREVINALKTIDGTSSDLEEMLAEELPCNTGHRLLGHGHYLQNEARKVDEQLLLQIDMLPGEPMIWGDAGMAYFVIDSDALKRGDFSRVTFTTQCY